MDGLIDAGKLIDDYKPALIHVHGSEHCLGLAHQHASWQAPTVLSLQGILRAYAPRALGELDLWDVIRQERLVDLCRMAGVVGIRRAWRKAAQFENVILNAHRHFIGHNSWDKAQLYAANPNAIYHHVGDPVRREFFDTAWHPSRYRRNTVFFGNLAGAHKGGHTIVRALPILARDFPEVHFRLAGRLGTKGGYGRLFLNEAARLGIADRVTFLGFLDATSMARELAHAHVFVSASHIDNNPSSVAEAQAVGTPIVASYVGGVPEMLDDGRAGLFFPAGDPEMLAYRLSQVFRSDPLAESMSAAGRRQVDIRHNPKTIVGELAGAYAAAGCDLPKR
jgi:glycosyltransferase involved in cell wall biosynthesis